MSVYYPRAFDTYTKYLTGGNYLTYLRNRILPKGLCNRHDQFATDRAIRNTI